MSVLKQGGLNRTAKPQPKASFHTKAAPASLAPSMGHHLILSPSSTSFIPTTLTSSTATSRNPHFNLYLGSFLFAPTSATSYSHHNHCPATEHDQTISILVYLHLAPKENDKRKCAEKCKIKMLSFTHRWWGPPHSRGHQNHRSSWSLQCRLPWPTPPCPSPVEQCSKSILCYKGSKTDHCDPKICTGLCEAQTNITAAALLVSFERKSQINKRSYLSCCGT